MDLMSILPLLAGGNNPDIGKIMAAMGKSPAPSAPPPANPEVTPSRGKPNYAKLYPNTPINDLPRTDAPKAAASQPDMNNMLQLFAALNAAKKQQSPPTPPPTPIVATAPREIRDSLRAILSLNELEQNKSGKASE